MKKIFFCSLLLGLKVCGTEPLVTFESPREIIHLVKKYLPSRPVIVEAGAYEGDETLFLSNNWHGRCKIYSFEPVPHLYNIAKTNTQSHSNIILYNLALGASCGAKPFYLSNLGDNPTVTASSSLLKPKDHLVYSPDTYFNNHIEVECTTLDEWARNNNVEAIDLLWFDLQGSELDVMKASPFIMKNVKAVLTEVEFVEAYEGQALYSDIKEWLESQGFTLIALGKGGKWFGDALFVRM